MSNKKFRLLFLLFLVAAYFPLFLHLDVLPLRMFDESRVGMNAMEMAEHGNWLVPHYNGKPDMWNLKPPLMIWLQVATMKVLGYQTLAVRLPSALAGLATILLVLWFGVKVLRNNKLGFFAALVLLTTPGFVSIHVSRTGEYDALLCFFLLASALQFFRFLHDEDPSVQQKSLWYFGAFLALAVLTKSIAGLFFLPGLLLYALAQKKVLWMLCKKQVYWVAFSVLAIILFYYLGREMINPGYLQAVIENEWSGRFKEGLENHKKPFAYYFKRTFEWQFRPWIFYLPLAVWVATRKSTPLQLTRLIVFLSTIGLTFFLVISSAQTKLGWYNAPAFPVLALLVGVGLTYAFEKGSKTKFFSKNKTKLVAYTLAFLFLVFGYPYGEIIKKSYFPEDKEWNKESMRFETFMKKIDPATTYNIASTRYNSHLDFQVNAARYSGKDLSVVSPYFPKDTTRQILQINESDTIVFCEERIEKVLQRNFIYQEHLRWKSCALIHIQKIKK